MYPVDSVVDSDSSLCCEQHPGCNSRLRLKHHAAADCKRSLWFGQDLLHSASLTQSGPKQRDPQVVELHRCGPEYFARSTSSCGQVLKNRRLGLHSSAFIFKIDQCDMQQLP
mmetsp:Transcript_81356/g.128658  ORF Transcript_81356/g.128658 Transcript_81356/m.128658 type:complete len:112 (-) Transcript_81356:1608-1943(-)